jgi:hypothetical protein
MYHSSCTIVGKKNIEKQIKSRYRKNKKTIEYQGIRTCAEGMTIVHQDGIASIQKIKHRGKIL